MSQLPRLVDGVAVSESSDPDGRHAVFVPPDRSLRISPLAAELLRRIDGRTSLAVLAAQLRAEHGQAVSADELHELLEQTLVRAGLVRFGAADPDAEESRAGSVVVLGEKGVNALAGLLSPAFGWLGLPLLVLSLGSLLLVSAGSLARPVGAVHGSAWLACLLLAVPLQLAHELGHAAAMRRHGLRPGAIGLARRGPWLVSPYIDAARACLLPSSQRLSVYAGGAYIQLLLAGAAVAGSAALPSTSRLAGLGVLLAGLLLAEGLASLAPLGDGTDGSWLLHDLPGGRRRAFVAAWLAAGGAWCGWMLLVPGPAIVATLTSSWPKSGHAGGLAWRLFTLLVVGLYLLGLTRALGSLAKGVAGLLRLATAAKGSAASGHEG